MTKFSTIRILAISGSLRSASSNTRLLQAAIALAPEGVEIGLYEGLGELPHFNPDHENDEIPAVTDLRSRLLHANGVLISSPEYAHGVPGVLKNALDWVVGTGELVDKPVALFNASARSTYAQASLIETITVMSGRIIMEASMTLPFLDKHLDAAEIAAHPEIAILIKATVDAFVRAIEAEG